MDGKLARFLGEDVNKSNEFVDKLTEILQSRKALKDREANAIKKAFVDSEIEQFDEFLIEEDVVEKEQLLVALGQYYQAKPFDVTGCFFDHELLKKFPKNFLLEQEIIPVEVDGDILSVVAADPNKDSLESMIKDYASYDIIFMVGLARDICDAVKEFYDKSISEVDYDEDLREERKLEAEAEEIEDSGKPII